MTPIDTASQCQRLNEVISTVHDLTRRRVSSLAIFDLDGTLLDNRPRTIYILKEIAEFFDDELPELCRAVERPVDFGHIAYTIPDTLERLGVRSPTEIEFIQAEWSKRFFSDAYQRFDFPLPGAKRFVEKVHRAGATVCYLTGRDVGRMLVGTTESLRQYGFPVGVIGTMTIVKTDIKVEDAAFKHETVDYLQRLGTVVAVFENEPENANMFLRAFPYSESFLLDTHHRPDAPAIDPRLRVIRDFHCSQRTS